MLLSTALRIHPKDVVALAGGGGKTTAMFRLAEELRALNRRVVTTMTTKIFVAQMACAPAHLILETEDALLARLGPALAQHGHVLIAGGSIVEQDKVQGVPPELLDRVAAQPAVDAVIVEADGSRRLPFKAPAAHEPVIPASTCRSTPRLCSTSPLAKARESSSSTSILPVAISTGGMAGDTGGYFVGHALGRHKLTPRVSPGKTVEGAVGIVAASLLGATVAKLVFLQGASWPEIVWLGGIALVWSVEILWGF